MFHTCFALMEAQHALVTARQLAADGLVTADVRRLLRDGALVRVRHGVYAEGDAWRAADTYRGRPLMSVRAAGLVLRAQDYAFSHDSAALLLDMGVPDAARALVHVTRPKTHGDLQRAGTKHHLAPFLPGDLEVIEGLRTLGPARTALDMVREHGRAAGLAACDAALRRGVSREELAEVFGRMSCWPRSRTMRWCIEMADAGAETYLESIARDLVLELGIGRPQTQFGLTDGTRTVWCDMRVGRQLFEADGELKYDEDNPSGLTGREVLRLEKERQDFISGFKLGVSRVTHHHCHAGRAAARVRMTREYNDTCDRFGTSIDDLAPYIVTRRRPA